MEKYFTTTKEIPRLGRFYPGIIEDTLLFDTAKQHVLRKQPWNLNQHVNLPASLSISQRNFHLSREHEGGGMHKVVTSRLTADVPRSFNLSLKCYAMFAEQVTNSFSLDVYEIERTKEYTFYYKNYIDIEKSSAEAENHTLLVFQEIVQEEMFLHATYDLTWHIRYHQPNGEAYYILVTLPAPIVYVTCIDANELTNFASENSSVLEDRVLGPCPIGVKQLCLWLPINVTTDGSLQFSWPVGQSQQQLFVTAVTCIVTFASTLVIILTVIK
ncbi:unnamed protein product [Clavelina lepadiformis]|uniref:Phosphatidylinositol-glycan biosynthesis class X protein n=1 Tax=Clavelina lepadiformis TaxID=159417 RepID=A0ABP0F1S3_CLALP